MFNNFFQNARKPQGRLGKLVLICMNSGHAKVAAWGFSYLHVNAGSHILDIGCGGGANIAKMLKDFPGSIVDGIDYSEESVAVSQKTNASELGKQCNIRQGDVSCLPYPNQSLDLVTAFETIYFWPDLDAAFKEIKRVLKQGGIFFVCCEVENPDTTTWTDRIDGMTIHRGEDLKKRLLQIGFQSVDVHGHKKGWMCVKAVC
jgi:ubiquinone/menaquinone biosynthesis C-methylase UbiE